MKIKIATSIKYGNYKHLQEQAAHVVSLINKYKTNFAEEFRWDPRMVFVIRPIKGSWTRGRAVHAYDYDVCDYYTSEVEIDPRFITERNDKRVLETIAHELTHATQVYDNKLSFERGMNVWCNKVYGGGSMSYEAYLNLPWEIEAREQAERFVNKYWKP